MRVEYAGTMTNGVRERVVCGLANVAHLRRNAKQGGTSGDRVLEHGDEGREDSCTAATAGVEVACKSVVVFPDTAHKLDTSIEPARMYVHTMIHGEHVGKVKVRRRTRA